MDATATKPRSALRRFLDSEAAGGILLMLAAALAMLAANSGLSDLYFGLVHAVTGPVLSDKLGPMTVHLWINDGLMAVFFFLVGLEIKREFVDGRLASWNDRALPCIAAAAGMAVPALLYIAFTGGTPGLGSGWAIPAATDIAFALGVLALLGKRAPASLKLFLLTVAIVDDLGAVAIIAVFYTASLKLGALAVAGVILAAMFTGSRFGVRSIAFYVTGAILLWFAVLLSGVHATVAGVLAAMTVPIVKSPAAPDAPESLLHKMEHALAPYVGFLVVPIFGFANAGVSLAGVGAEALLSPLPLGIAAGLFLGKQIGIFGAVWLTVRAGLAPRLTDASWAQIYGVSVLCGIGFTMSLFIGGLAFPGQPALIDEAKIGILLGSVLSAATGYLVLRLAAPRAPR